VLYRVKVRVLSRAPLGFLPLMYLVSMRDILLLHCCCAPCSCAVIATLKRNAIDVHLFFFNPNIYPEEEYLRRKQELGRYALYSGVQCIDADYIPENWFSAVSGYENEPECGKRCELCIRMRLLKTAQYAQTHGYEVFATTLGMSPLKGSGQISEAGLRAVAAFPKTSFLDYPWRKGGSLQEMTQIVRELQIYRQNYCGCLYSKKLSTF
jgi:epoxyqueuosine reductase